MASTLSPSAVGGTPTARIGLDLSALIAGPSIARTAGQSIAREISNAFKPLQNEQRLALEQARQTTVGLRTQQSQISSSARAESAVRVAAAKAEQAERTQAARATASATIEAERRATAEFRSQLRQRDAAARTSAAQQRALLRGGATFAGAAFGGPIGGVAGALAGGSAALPLAAGLLAGQGLQFAGQSIRAASDLTEAINKVNVAFDAAGQGVLKWSQNSATALGQSRHDALEAASSFGLLFREMGLGSQRSAAMSESMVELAADMASIHNIRPEDALEKLRAGLIGETRPLRDVGILLSDQTVRLKAVEMGLADTTAAVTDQERVLARYQMILEQTTLTQGDFQRTIGGLANQQRIASAQWEDAQTKLGKLLEAPVGVVLAGWNNWLSQQIAMMDAYTEAIQRAGRALGMLPAASAAMSGSIGSRTSLGVAQREGIPSLQRTFRDENGDLTEAGNLIVERSRHLQTIDRRMNEQIIDSASQYAKRRADTIATYEKQIARDAEDYGRQRVRAQAKFEQSIAKVQSDGAERRAELQSKYDEDVADARNKSNKKLANLQADYDKDRERAERSHRDTLLDAAARLDAVAVMAEQRRFAEEKRNREEDHAEAIKEEKDSLDEQLEERRKNYADQLAEARRNDAERIADLTAAFEEQRAQEEEDRTLRLERQATDHAAQLTEMDNQQVERIAQIKTNAADERQQYEEEFQRAAVAAGIRIQAWIDQNNKVTDEAIKSFDRLMDEIIKRTILREQALANQGGIATPGGPILSRASGGPINRTGPVLAHAGEYMLSPQTTTAVRNTIGSFDQAGLVAALQGGGGGRSVTIESGAIVVNGAVGQSEERLGMIVRAELIAALQAAA